MKKIVTFLLILVVCTSVFAFDVSFGGFLAKKDTVHDVVYAGGFVSVAYKPFSYENADFGFKADYIIGVNKDKESSTIGSVKGVVSFDVDNFSILGGLGVAFNGLQSGKIAFVTEADASYYFTKNIALGLSFDCAFGVRDFSTGSLEEVKIQFAPAGKAFLTYTF